LSTGDIGDRDDITSCAPAQSTGPDDATDRHATNQFTISAV